MQDVYSPSSAVNLSALDTQRVLRNTYSLLAVTLLVSAVAAFIGLAIGIPKVLSIVFSLAALGILWFVLPKVANSAAGIWTVFGVSALLGAGLAPTLAHYLNSPAGGMIIMQALAGTAFVFFALSAYVLTTRKDFSFMGGFLMIGLLTVVIASIAGLLFSLFGAPIPALQLAISGAVVLLMSGFILFDTSRIIHGGETNYVMATVSLYLNILNLFTSLLHLLGIMNDE